MSRRIEHRQLVSTAEVVATPALRQRACTDHNFGLPTRIYVAMGALFVTAVAVLATAFTHDMLLSYGVVFAFLTAFFAVPTLFVKTSPPDGAKALQWTEFRDRGIDTATGHASAREATILTLLLPAFIVGWAIAVVTIAVLVR
jgi:hypothetical protein